MFLKKAFSRVFSRIFVSTLGVSAVVVAGLAAGTFYMFDSLHDKGLEKSMADSSSLIAAAINGGESMASVAALCSEFSRESGIRATIIAADGKVLFDSDADKDAMTNHLGRPEIQAAFRGERSLVSRFSNTLKTRMLYLAVPAGKSRDGAYEYCVRLAMPSSSAEFARAIVAKEVAALAALAVLFSAAVSYFLARTISVPLNALRESAQSFADGDFDRIVDDSSILEISQLGKSMSSMARQLKKRMNSLHKRNCELGEIFSHMSECVLICTDEGLLLRTNDAARKILGIRHDENSRPKIEDAIRIRPLVAAIVRTFEENRSISCDIEIPGSDGMVMSLESVPLPYESRTRRALFVLHDMSLERAAEKLRREFVAAVSHELKTPITGIMGATEILSEGADQKESAHLLDIIGENSARMNSLVEDMLTLSKIESDDYMPNLSFSDCDIREILEKACAMHREEAAARSQTVGTECGGGLVAKADAALLSLAVSNLVGNAVKYSGEGARITVAAKRSGNFAEISVSDTGPGIGAEHQGRIFERFYRIGKGRWRNSGGSGIGLSIVKHVAIIHGGAAAVKSEPGRGSTFTITLKLDPENGGQENTPD